MGKKKGRERGRERWTETLPRGLTKFGQKGNERKKVEERENEENKRVEETGRGAKRVGRQIPYLELGVAVIHMWFSRYIKLEANYNE